MTTDTWVLLRGLSRSARHWGDFPLQLAQALPGRRVLTIDLPGNGGLAQQRSALSVPTMVEQARQQLRAAGVTSACHLVALSLGGMVACEWARTAPQELRSVVLINTSLRGVSPIWQRLRPASYPALLRLALSPCSDAQWENTLYTLTSQRAEPRQRVVERWTTLRQQERVTRLNTLRQLLAAARYRAPAQPPSVPLLVLGSRADQLVDCRCSQALAARWGTRLALHATAGHDLPLDAPDWLIEQLQGWDTAQP
jgi:pimeloyl-ACP methyl ester carboxylesterase